MYVELLRYSSNAILWRHLHNNTHFSVKTKRQLSIGQWVCVETIGAIQIELLVMADDIQYICEIRL